MSTLYWTSLPTEIHILILNLLEREDMRSCLVLNKEAHDIALPLLYRSIRLNITNTDPDQHTFGQSEEFLGYLSHNTSVASIVRRLTIYYKWIEVKSKSPDIWRQIFSTFPNLESFQWLGQLPPHGSMPNDLRNLNPLLTECSIPSNFPMPETRMENLRALKFDEKSFYSDSTSDGGSSQRRPRLADQDIIYATIVTLRSLVISASDLSEVWDRLSDEPNECRNTQILCQNLTSLDLLVCYSLHIQLSMMQGFTKLQDLTIHDINSYLFGQDVKGWVFYLPALTSFRVTCQERLSEIWIELFEDIGEFIEAHPLLRRLDINIPGAWEAISALLPTISKLEKLEILGFTAEFDMPLEGLDELFQHIPTRVTSLGLVFTTLAERLTPKFTMDDLLSHLSRFPRLRLFLLDSSRLLGNRGSSVSDVQVIVEHLNRLEWIIWDQRMWSVLRDPEGFPRLRPQRKQSYGRALSENLSNEDHEWLMRYKCIN